MSFRGKVTTCLAGGAKRPLAIEARLKVKIKNGLRAIFSLFWAKVFFAWTLLSGRCGVGHTPPDPE